MSSYRTALRSALASERQAYGFTLVIWASGAMVAAVRGTAGAADAVAYVGGAMAAMGLGIVATLSLDDEDEPSAARRMTWSAIHLASVAAAVAGAWGVAELVHVRWLAYFGAGLVAATAYQLVLALENSLAGRG